MPRVRVTSCSLERSLQNCSLSSSSSSGVSDGVINNNHNQGGRPEDGVPSSSSSSSSTSDDNSTFVQLNSHISLPYHWEQCLDLKTGELYYINWSTGRKAKEDPRTTVTGYNGDYYSEEDDDDDDDDDDSSSAEEESSRCESEESSSCSSTREHFRSLMKKERYQPRQQAKEEDIRKEEVLVVAGCKGCFMYYMVPKHVDQCPKCSAQLLHFPSSHNSPTPY